LEETEKIFGPDLRVVDANPGRRGALLQFGGMGCLGLVMAYLLYLGLAWLAETLGESFTWLARIGSLLLLLLCLFLFWGVALTMQDSLRQMRFAAQLRRKGLLATACVVGREKIDRIEEDIYYMFCQFRPDFVLRFHDSSPGQRFYRLPLGSEVRVRYLEGQPEVSSLVLDEK
jgi:hypothetical protein